MFLNIAKHLKDVTIMDRDCIEARWEMLSQNGKMSAKQISIRLPIDLESKIDDLISLYPNVTKSQIICDLVSLGVNQISVSHHA